MSLKSQVYYNALFGGLGALVAWLFLYISAIANDYHILLRDVIAGAVVGTFIGIGVSLVEGLIFRRSLKVVPYGAALGSVGGIVGAILGELILYSTTGGTLGRAIAWSIIGGAIGISQGMVNRSPAKSSYGGIGGGIGGALGGAVFESLRQAYSSYLLSQALGLFILGAFIGAFIVFIDYIISQILRLFKQPEPEESLAQQAIDRDLSQSYVASEKFGSNWKFIPNWMLVEPGEYKIEDASIQGSNTQLSLEDIWLERRRPTASANPHSDEPASSFGKRGKKFFKLFILGLILTAAWLFIFLNSPAAKAEWHAQLNQIEKADFPKIILYLNVRDADGNPISTLQKTDFALKEDGISAPIEHLITPKTTQPLKVALVIDRSGSMAEQGKLQWAKRAAITFVQLMNESDAASLFTFSDRSEQIQPLTMNKALVIESIDKIKAGGNTRCYDTVCLALKSLQKHRGKKAVILLTDGLDNKSRNSLRETIQLAAYKFNIPVYTIGLGYGSATSIMGIIRRPQIDEAVLTRLAEETGGLYYHAPSAQDLVQLYRLIYAQLRGGYTLFYTTPRKIKDGTQRRVAVSVKYAGQFKRTQTGFYYIPGVLIPKSSLALFIIIAVPVLLLIFLPVFIHLWRNSKIPLR